MLGTNAAVADTDGDRVLDGVEFRGYASNPLVQDTDGDGCRDAKEVASLNFDRTVNVADLGMVAVHYSPPGGPNYVYELDVNKDGAINAADLGFVAVQTGAC